MARGTLGDPEQKPPAHLRAHFKRWQHASAQEINESPDIVDLQHNTTGQLRPVSPHGNVCEALQPLSSDLTRLPTTDTHLTSLCKSDNVRQAYEVNNLPGLLFYPGLLSEDMQVAMLDKIVHRDLSNPVHQTNLHFHHSLPYDDLADVSPGNEHVSFFGLNSAISLQAKDPASHKPLTVEQMLRRRLRWMTLGGQYNWTRKVYPTEDPPAFPNDLYDILKGHFPDIDAQAAIVNFYTPGDTLSIHRDISEESDCALISISIGCDGLFLVADQAASRLAVLRLRSGDAVLMSGESRIAWHGVPKILEHTCPQTLQAWPCVPGSGQFEQWHGWLGSKRININVRQMKDTPLYARYESWS